MLQHYFPCLDITKGVVFLVLLLVLLLLQLNPSRHFNVCFKHCQKPRQLICQCRQSYTGATLLNSWQKSSVYMCFSILLTF